MSKFRINNNKKEFWDLSYIIIVGEIYLFELYMLIKIVNEFVNNLE